MRGNARTRDYVIRREFDLAEGDAFNRVLIDRAERRLQQSRLFQRRPHFHRAGLLATTASIVVVRRGRAADRRVLVRRRLLDVGDGIVGDISLTERNFLGRGYNLRIVGRRRHELAQLRVRLHRSLFPRSANLGRLRTSTAATYEDNDFRSYDYETTRRRPDLRLPDHREFHAFSPATRSSSRRSTSTTTSATTRMATRHE